MNNKNKTIIGRFVDMFLPTDSNIRVPVKIDTGADRSAIWASNIYIDEKHYLHYVLFNESSQYYTGKVHKTKNYSASVVRSSNGLAQIRYRVALSIMIESRKIKAQFTLADRSKNRYPVLIGSTLLAGRFLVDTSIDDDLIPYNKSKHTHNITNELKSNPKQFFEKYHKNNPKGDVRV